MTHYVQRRMELLGARRRRPKTGDRATLERYRAQLAHRVLEERARAAARRLERVLNAGLA